MFLYANRNMRAMADTNIPTACTDTHTAICKLYTHERFYGVDYTECSDAARGIQSEGRQ